MIIILSTKNDYEYKLVSHIWFEGWPSIHWDYLIILRPYPQRQKCDELLSVLAVWPWNDNVTALSFFPQRGFGSVHIECAESSEAEAQEKRGADNDRESFLMMLPIALASHFGEKSKWLFWNGHTDYMCENGKTGSRRNVCGCWFSRMFPNSPSCVSFQMWTL